MNVLIGFPLADIRKFYEGETGKLPLPLWPSPTPYRDFVRSSGQVKARGWGGLAGWVGENFVCDARRAIKLLGPLQFQNRYSLLKIPVKCAARHFYFDGLAVGKLEIVLNTLHSWGLSGKTFNPFLSHLLNVPVRIQIPSGGPKQTKLCLAGAALAQRYVYSSTYTRFYPSVEGKKWVAAGEPLVFVQLRHTEDLLGDLRAKEVYLPKELGLSLRHLWHSEGGKRYRVWILTYRNGAEQTRIRGRSLRLYLMRLHTECECLRAVLKSMAAGELSPQAGSQLSANLQEYLNTATRHISRMSNRLKERYEIEDIEQLALTALDEINPGERDGLLEALRLAQVRPQVHHKVTKFADQIFIIKEPKMGDEYHISGPVGAAGYGARAENFSQTWINSQEKIDLMQLARELYLLQSKMNAEAAKPEQNEAVHNVVEAEKAAQDGNGPKVLEHLKKAGQWALDVAQKIGVSLATEALKIALGLSTP